MMTVQWIMLWLIMSSILDEFVRNNLISHWYAPATLTTTNTQLKYTIICSFKKRSDFCKHF